MHQLLGPHDRPAAGKLEQQVARAGQWEIAADAGIGEALQQLAADVDLRAEIEARMRSDLATNPRQESLERRRVVIQPATVPLVRGGDERVATVRRCCAADRDGFRESARPVVDAGQ